MQGVGSTLVWQNKSSCVEILYKARRRQHDITENERLGIQVSWVIPVLTASPHSTQGESHF